MVVVCDRDVVRSTLALSHLCNDFGQVVHIRASVNKQYNLLQVKMLCAEAWNTEVHG